MNKEVPQVLLELVDVLVEAEEALDGDADLVGGEVGEGGLEEAPYGLPHELHVLVGAARGTARVEADGDAPALHVVEDGGEDGGVVREPRHLGLAAVRDDAEDVLEQVHQVRLRPQLPFERARRGKGGS